MIMQGEWRHSITILDGCKVDVIDSGSCAVLDSNVDVVELPTPTRIL
jgi:hypothetical protein